MKEQSLVRACQSGDRQAFEELIRLFYPYVAKFLLKMTGDELLSEDLTQETFLKMIRGIDRYDPGGKAGFGTWLIAIAKNCYVDSLRRNRVVLSDVEELQLGDPFDMADSVLQKMTHEEVLRAVESLPAEQGLAIRLKYEQGMTLAEIAERFGVPQKTVKSRIHEGTVKLRKLFHISGKEKSDDT